jgi:hypothetical protein
MSSPVSDPSSTVFPLADAVFERQGELYVPSGHARGPWDPGSMHGGPPSALIAQAVQATAPQMQIVRMSFDFLGAVPLVPLSLELHELKPGRRLRIVEATLSTDERAVMVARVALMRRGEVPLPEGARTDDELPGDGPAASRRMPFPRSLQGGEPQSFGATAMSVRFSGGGDWSGGPAQAWFRLEHPLVAGVETAPVARVAVAADFLNGVSRMLPWDGWLFVNNDLTISLWRDPVGDQVRIDARTQLEPTGIGQASGELYDERGQIGRAQQSLFVEPR